MRKAGVMPRETVFSDVGDFVVTVGWSREQYVQVATECVAEPEVLRQRVLDLLNEGSATNPDGRHVFRGWYTTLDRTQVNNLIRLLRKARDSAYGADA